MNQNRMPLYIQIILGLIGGVIWAFISGHFGLSAFTSQWIAPIGRIFLNLLKLIAIPLVFFSIIAGVTRLGNPRNLGRLGGKTLLLYVATTLFSISLGLLIVNVFKPGKYLDDDLRIENRLNYELWLQSEGLSPKDGKWFINNPAYIKITEDISQKKGLNEVENLNARLQVAEKAKERGPLAFLEEVVPENIFFAMQNNRSMLQIIFFAVFFGVAVLYLPSEKSGIILKAMDAITEAFIKMVEIVMKGAPWFVFALMAGVIVEMAGDNSSIILELFKGLTWYSLSVVAGLLIMAFIVYPTLMAIFVKGLSFSDFLKAISPAQMLAFSTSSSAATLPVTIECVEENLKIDKKITSFVLPIGATINMDGTSLYQVIAVVFLAQMHMVDLSLGQQLTIILTTTLASIGAAAIPGAGVVMLMVVLTSVGLNPAWIAIILPVDRILDMVRTMVNVTGDATVCVIVGKTASS